MEVDAFELVVGAFAQSPAKASAPAEQLPWCLRPCQGRYQPGPFLESVARVVAEAEAKLTPHGTVTLHLPESLESFAAECNLHAAELEIIGTIFYKILDGALDDLRLVLRGAHVLLLGDGGWFHDWIKGLDGAYARVSSHFSSAPQYGVGLVGLKTLLAGRDKSGNSWFQFEANEWHPGGNVCASIQHAGTSLEYFVTGLNIGPFGYSSHTDANPLIKHAAWERFPCSLDHVDI